MGPSSLAVKIFLFLNVYSFGKQSYRMNAGEGEIFHLLICSLNGCRDGQDRSQGVQFHHGVPHGEQGSKNSSQAAWLSWAH